MAGFMTWLALLGVPFSLLGGNLGTHGSSFPIEEIDLLTLIRERAEAWVEQEPDRRIQAAIHNLKEPKAIDGLSLAQEYRFFDYDPSITLAQDIVDADGKVLFLKGTRVNPLDIVSLNKTLLFFDGSDEGQVEWARAEGDKTAWILVKGKPLDLEEEEERPVYFDQHGVLISKLHISHIPAKVSQNGVSLLKIEEIPVGGG